MPRMDTAELRAILAAEKADALAADKADKLSSERANAMAYYLGDVSKDLPTEDGRSSAVSSDVADTIEGMLPSLMEIFAGSEEVVKFDPVGPEDEQAAQQETDYVNHVFMQRNPGFIVLYSFIKDALLSKIGIVKGWWEKDEREEDRETYLDQTADELAVLVADPEMVVVEHSEHDGLHDVTLAKRKDYSCVRVEAVPPEEFGISRRARSLKNCGYCFHEVRVHAADLLADGYDKAQVDAIPSYSSNLTLEQQRRDTVNENAAGMSDEGENKANRQVLKTEHYVRLDYEGDGKAALYRVSTGGEQGEVLLLNGKPDVERIDFIPFAAITPVIITHRFFGRSVADLVMDIQRIKTALLRGLLDGTYLALHPRVEVAQSHANENTLDDLLVSRPGGVIRTKQPGGLNWLKTPDLGATVLPVMQFMDATREWRTGVTRQGQGVDPNALQNQVATIANQMASAAQAKIKLVARIFAETGMRDLFTMVHAIIRKNGGAAQTVRLRNQWVTVDPRNWKTRNDMTINVGLGSGTLSERAALMTQLIGFQEKAAQAGKSNLVTDQNLYNAAKEWTKLLQLKNPDLYFTDPSTQPPPTPPPDPKLVEIQARSGLEADQAKADIASQALKTQSEIALAERRFELEQQLKLLDAQLQHEQHQQQMALRAATAAEQQPAVVPTASLEMKHQAGDIVGPIGEMMTRLGEHLANSSAQHMQMLTSTLAAHMEANSKPRQIRGPSGKIYTIEPATPQ
jgi:hypothetical protein